MIIVDEFTAKEIYINKVIINKILEFLDSHRNRKGYGSFTIAWSETVIVDISL